MVLLFAPGAGASSTHPWMRRWTERLAVVGTVRTLDYPYMLSGSRRPDPMPKLIAAHRAALVEARSSAKEPAILIGKSMGSRVGCHLSLEDKVAALICFGYPLCGGGDPSRLRDKVLREISTPILFIQGTRDPLCPLELLDSVRREMRAPNELHVLEGGDHSLAVTKTQLKAMKETQEDVDDRILTAIRAFVTRYVLSRGV